MIPRLAENHKTQTEFDDSMVIKTFAFDAFNSYFALFYIAYLKSGVLFGEALRNTHSDAQNLD